MDKKYDWLKINLIMYMILLSVIWITLIWCVITKHYFMGGMIFIVFMIYGCVTEYKLGKDAKKMGLKIY